jgi:hypothetical protein
VPNKSDYNHYKHHSGKKALQHGCNDSIRRSLTNRQLQGRERSTQDPCGLGMGELISAQR